MNILSGAQFILDQGDAGREQRFNRLAGQAANATGATRTALLNEATGLNAAGGMALQDKLQEREFDKSKRLAGAARYVLNAHKSGNPQAVQGAWQHVRPFLAEITGKEVPDQWTDDMLPAVHQVIAAGGGEGSDEGVPTGMRQFQMQAEAAGLQPGTPEYQQAARVALGMAPRAVAGSRQLKEVSINGRPTWVVYDPANDSTRIATAEDFEGSAQPPAGPPQASVAPSGGASQVLASSFDDAVEHVLKTEGGYVANDAGAGPTNFGINSRANPDLNVASLSPDQVKQVYRDRYWNAVDADNLPPNIRMAVFDAAVNQGPQKALELYRESGGDPARFAQLRQAHYDSLVAQNPQKYGQYAEGWRTRNARTAGIPLAGLTPGEKAAQEEAAKLNARLGMEPQIEAAKTTAKTNAELSLAPRVAAAEADKTARVERAKAQEASRAEAAGELSGLREDLIRLKRVRDGFKQGKYSTGWENAYIPDQFQSTNNQVLATDVNQMILSLAEKMKGTLSDKDVAFLRSASVDLNKDEKANAQIIQQVLERAERAYVRAQTKAGQAPKPPGGPRVVRTQAEYDALPRGALYVEDGKTYRKP